MRGERPGRRRRREPRRFTYSRWDGTQSGPDLDADALLRAMGDELIEHGDPNDALRRILRDGLEVDGERLQGLWEMLEQLRQQRQEMLESHDLGGVYDEIRDAVCETETRLSDDRLAGIPVEDLLIDPVGGIAGRLRGEGSS